MATLFYPGCQIKKDYPEASKKLAEYIQSKRPVEVVGCCRVDHGKSTQADTALVVCNNCANIIAESGDPGSIEFVWEIIDNDPDFPFPDYHGEKMTIQDCWLAVEKRHVQDAIRSLMRKMNIQVVELPENHEKTTFCGMNLTAECNPSNAKLAPKRYVEEGGHMFRPCPRRRARPTSPTTASSLPPTRWSATASPAGEPCWPAGRMPGTFCSCSSRRDERATTP